MTEPLLELSTLAPERPNVMIKTPDDPEGSLYELKVLKEFGIAEQQGLMRDGNEYDKLWGSEHNLTSNERKRLKMLLDRMFDAVLLAPQKVKELIDDSARSQIVLAFTLAPLMSDQTEQMEDEETTVEDSSLTTVS